MENRIIPPTAMACARKFRKAGQSAVPVRSWALRVMIPNARAASGFFRMTMKSPPIHGNIEKPSMVKSGTFERRILRVSE